MNHFGSGKAKTAIRGSLYKCIGLALLVPVIGTFVFLGCKPRSSRLSNEENPFQKSEMQQFAEVSYFVHIYEQHPMSILKDSRLFTEAYSYFQQSPYIRVRGMAAFLITKIIEEQQSGAFPHVILYPSGQEYSNALAADALPEGRKVESRILINELLETLLLRGNEGGGALLSQFSGLPRLCYDLSTCQSMAMYLVNLNKSRGPNSEIIAKLVAQKFQLLLGDVGLIKDNFIRGILLKFVEAAKLSSEFYTFTNLGSIQHEGIRPFFSQAHRGRFYQEAKQGLDQLIANFVEPGSNLRIKDSIAAELKRIETPLFELLNSEETKTAKDAIIRQKVGEVSQGLVDMAQVNSGPNKSFADDEFLARVAAMDPVQRMIKVVGDTYSIYTSLLFWLARMDPAQSFSSYLDCVSSRASSYRDSVLINPSKFVEVNSTKTSCPQYALKPLQALTILTGDKFQIGHEASLPTGDLFVSTVTSLRNLVFELQKSASARPSSTGLPATEVIYEGVDGNEQALFTPNADSLAAQTLSQQAVSDREQRKSLIRGWLQMSGGQVGLLDVENELVSKFSNFHGLYHVLSRMVESTANTTQDQAVLKAKVQEVKDTITEGDKQAIVQYLNKIQFRDNPNASETTLNQAEKWLETQKYKNRDRGEELWFFTRWPARAAGIALSGASEEYIKYLDDKKKIFERMNSNSTSNMASGIELGCYERAVGLRNSKDFMMGTLTTSTLGGFFGCQEMIPAFREMVETYSKESGLIQFLTTIPIANAYTFSESPIKRYQQNLGALASLPANQRKAVNSAIAKYFEVSDTINLSTNCGTKKDGELIEHLQDPSKAVVDLDTLCDKDIFKLRKNAQCYLDRRENYQVCATATETWANMIANDILLSMTVGPVMKFMQPLLGKAFIAATGKDLLVFASTNSITKIAVEKGLVAIESHGSILRQFISSGVNFSGRELAKLSWFVTKQVMLRGLVMGIPKIVINGMAINAAQKAGMLILGQPIWDPTKSTAENLVVMAYESLQMGVYTVYTPTFDALGQGTVGWLFSRNINFAQSRAATMAASLIITPMEEVFFMPVDLMIDGAFREVMQEVSGNPDWQNPRMTWDEFVFMNLKGAFTFKRAMIKEETRRVLDTGVTRELARRRTRDDYAGLKLATYKTAVRSFQELSAEEQRIKSKGGELNAEYTRRKNLYAKYLPADVRYGNRQPTQAEIDKWMRAANVEAFAKIGYQESLRNLQDFHTITGGRSLFNDINLYRYAVKDVLDGSRQPTPGEIDEYYRRSLVDFDNATLGKEGVAENMTTDHMLENNLRRARAQAAWEYLRVPANLKNASRARIDWKVPDRFEDPGSMSNNNPPSKQSTLGQFVSNSGISAIEYKTMVQRANNNPADLKRLLNKTLSERGTTKKVPPELVETLSDITKGMEAVVEYDRLISNPTNQALFREFFPNPAIPVR